jgi:hypothetical protein
LTEDHRLKLKYIGQSQFCKWFTMEAAAVWYADNIHATILEPLAGSQLRKDPKNEA